ncbi:hypothetical protein I3760_10G075000 [Carya illinoinensis]|uniref:Bifunctional inhibitor/plant lipid transfer protein/seed storage helical domain-containing protein n=1 Tax=Carya illinoinensis TaxID=32201 RepID=A0A8T1P8W5_CARIL|nr:non-specific lipid-transfer protein A-like [Carya illinoinensis]KAG2684392.1 hypothetical protein I3760_10G075000 [Carya illinoinensis]KAG6639075.1 hypothetical protein CIPAW_10G076000 [Carya illinoinensis]KAG6691664.1 hypothetical protein I3842_10G074800 [Carya illinoinensis]
MEEKRMRWSILAFGMVITALGASLSVAEISCSEALRSLITCTPFLVGFGSDAPDTVCCMGVQYVFEQANTTATRRDLCQCFQNFASEIGALPERVKELPQFCNIHVTLPIDANVNCSN